MGDVVNEMSDEVPKAFLWLRIFLPANMAISPVYHRFAVKAYPFLSFREVRHVKV
jgi:hypothetical protein